jgi:outer membrane protein assembly factor BamB
MIALLLPLALAAQEWPQFRGPGGRGVSEETGLPVEWSKDRGLRWKAALPGRGLSSPVVAGGRLYVTACTGVDQERLHVLCFDPRSGTKLWERQFHATGPTQCNGKTCMAGPTPAAEAGRVFALFATCDLAALDRDGNLLWYRSLSGDYPTIGNNVGIAASPVLHGGLLFVAMENVGDSFAAALDARTGVNRWKLSRGAKINWTTPLVVEHDGRPAVVFQSPDELTAHDPGTGKTVWRVEAKLASIPSPVAGEGLVFAPGGASVAIRGGERAWDSTQLQSATASPSFYKGRLYAVNSAGIVICADPKDGTVLWKTRATGPHSASPVFAQDRLYLVNEKGLTTVIQLGDEPKTLAENALDDAIMASPAVAGGALYLRSDRTLYCIGSEN